MIVAQGMAGVREAGKGSHTPQSLHPHPEQVPAQLPQEAHEQGPIVTVEAGFGLVDWLISYGLVGQQWFPGGLGCGGNVDSGKKK